MKVINVLKYVFRKNHFLLNTHKWLRTTTLNIRYKRSKRKNRKIVHFIHIGKTGGTAIKSVLKRYYSTKEFNIFMQDHEFKLNDALPGEYVFFVLRDPIYRFISGFYSRKRQELPRTFWPYSKEEKRAFGVFQTPNELGLALSSVDSVLRNQAQHAMKEIGHVNTSFWDWFENKEYLKNRLSDILFVGEQENLNKDFDELKRILGLPDYLKLPDNDFDAHRNPVKSDKSLDAIALQNLKKWYEKDYEFLSFLKSNGKI